MIRTKCQNMLRWSGQNANQKVGTDKMPTTKKNPDKMPTFGWHYVRLAFCPVGILSYHRPSTIIYQPVPPSIDQVPPSINQYQPILLLLGDYRLLHSLPWFLFLAFNTYFFWAVILFFLAVQDKDKDKDKDYP